MTTLDGIDVFVKVVQAGSFTGAAKILGMPVTTVSGKVANLEKRLGITLIHRTTRKLNVTDSGEAFFKRCVRALEELQAGESELANIKSEPEGVLRLTAPVDIGSTLLPPIVRSYLKTNPKMSIELILTNRLVDLVGEGVDLAIRVGRLKDSTLVATKFIETQAALWASASYVKKNGFPRHPKDLKDHEFIKFAMEQRVLKLSNGKDLVEVSTSGRITVDDMGALKSFILNGDGIGLVPSFLCEAEATTGKVVKILPTWTYGNVILSFVYPPQRFVSPKIQSFISWSNKFTRE